MIVVRCPRCGGTDWRSEQDYHLDLFMWGYTCVHCGEWYSERKWEGMMQDAQEEQARPNLLPAKIAPRKIAEMFDGEDSQ